MDVCNSSGASEILLPPYSIIELGPHPCQFNSPVLLEIPHFAALRGRQREIVVLRSDDAETWKEHSLEATDQAVRSALGSVFGELFYQLASPR